MHNQLLITNYCFNSLFFFFHQIRYDEFATIVVHARTDQFMEYDIIIYHNQFCLTIVILGLY